MKTNKVTILTVATLATLALANNAKADAQDSPVSSQEAPTALVTNPEGNNTTETKQPTEITKEGTEITVKNPEVVIDQSKGEGKYQEFTVEYKNIKFADDMPINSGDKVTMTFPEELNFQTKYEFDVKNPEDAVVGKASTNPEDRTVTTVFNDYFTNHPLNKQMSLKLDAKWTDKVQPGKPVSVNFNGTVVTANIGKEQVIGKDELVSKWGSQDKDDPTVINWTARINYAKRVLNYVTVIDEMSENQKLVDNYFEIKNIESLDPWIDKGDAMDLVKSISKSDHGFTIKMDRLDHMLYINYKTKLVNAVKDSVNPTNKIELKAENDGSTSYSYVQLVGGKGDASGENKPTPTFEIPNEAPKYEKPEWHGGIPGIPEERVKPEYTEPIGTIPNDAPILDKPEINIEDIPMMPPAPVLEKPEWKGGTVPFDAPQLDKPEWKGGVTPPDAPVLDKPELLIDIPDPKRDEPKPQPKEDEPNTPAPKTNEDQKVEEVKIVKSREKSSENHAKNESEETVEAYSAPAVLPATGSDLGLSLVALGISVVTLAFVLKRKES